MPFCSKSALKHPVENTTQTMTCPSCIHKDPRAIINEAKANASHSLPFHALDKPCVSSSWLSQIPSFRQETCQAYYRNDPVKYDLRDKIYSPTISNKGYGKPADYEIKT